MDFPQTPYMHRYKIIYTNKDEKLWGIEERGRRKIKKRQIMEEAPDTLARLVLVENDLGVLELTERSF
jgi:hypothetical protein